MHSPWAFDFITTTLFPGSAYGYYAYGEVEKRWRMFYRVLVRLGARRCVIKGDVPPGVKQVIALANVVIADEVKDARDVIVMTGSGHGSFTHPTIILGDMDVNPENGSVYKTPGMTVVIPGEGCKVYNL